MSSAPALSGRSLTELYAGKRVLLIGGTGFLGSVTLSMLMVRLPAIEKPYVAERMGWEWSSTLDEAIDMATSGNKNLEISMLHVPPLALVDVTP